MPALWDASYYWMAKTQSGVAYYFHAQGRPVKVSGYYEEKMQEEEMRERQEAMESYHKDTAFARQRRDKIQETYEEVCRFMRCYHSLARKTERN